MRSGAQTLVLLAGPLTATLLRTLARSPMQQAELRRAAGSPAQTTLRAQLKRLSDLGAIEKRRRNRFPGTLDYELTRAGRELLNVAESLTSWLSAAPADPLELGGNEARAAIKAFAEAWSSTMLRALAARPLALTELDQVIGAFSYPSLERRLGGMRLCGQVAPFASAGRGTPYMVTEWTRHAVTPLAAAIRWERRYLPQATAGLTGIDIEATFLLALPLVRLEQDQSGSCRIAAELADEERRRLAGVTVDITGGEVSSCVTRLEGSPDSWLLGSPRAWLDAVVEGDAAGLEPGGDCRLARSLLRGLRAAFLREGAKV